MADKVAKSDPELAKKVGLGEVSFPDAVAQVTGKPKKAALIPKVKEPIDDEGADQDDSVEALLSANAQLKEDNETLHRAAGIEDIPVWIRNGTWRDAGLFSLGAIAHHGLRRTNEDKCKAVQTLLADPEWAAWSDRVISRACSVSQPFVGSVRSHLKTLSDGPHLDTNPDSQPASKRTISVGGKTYQQDTEGVAESNKKRAKPKTEEPKPEEPAEEEGIEQDDVVEVLLAENTQPKKESDTLNGATGQIGLSRFSRQMPWRT